MMPRLTLSHPGLERELADMRASTLRMGWIDRAEPVFAHELHTSPVRPVYQLP